MRCHSRRSWPSPGTMRAAADLGRRAMRLLVVTPVLLCLGAKGGCGPCPYTPAHTEVVDLHASACPASLNCQQVCGTHVSSCECAVDTQGQALVICDFAAEYGGCG